MFNHGDDDDNGYDKFLCQIPFPCSLQVKARHLSEIGTYREVPDLKPRTEG